MRPIIFSEKVFGKSSAIGYWLSTLKKMTLEENFKKVTKSFQRLLNARLRELKVMKIRKSKYCGKLKSQSALKEEKSF